MKEYEEPEDVFIIRVESDSERIPCSLQRGLASEYDKEDFLAIRYLASLLRGIFICWNPCYDNIPCV
jgi:hypothetical protein